MIRIDFRLMTLRDMRPRPPASGLLLSLLPWLLMGMGCVSPGEVSRRLTAAPNLHSSAPSEKLKNFWDQALAGGADPFQAMSLAVGTPPIEMRVSVLQPADYHAVIHSELKGDGKGKGHLNATFRLSSAKPDPLPARGTIILIHGYMARKEVIYPWAFLLASQGWRVVAMDLRGHGESTGKTISFGALETRDLADMLAQLRARGVCSKPVGVMGVSMGANLALHWMAQDPNIDAAVAIAPYGDPTSTFRRIARALKIPVTEDSLSKGFALAEQKLEIRWANWSGEAAARKLRAPVLLIGGGQDAICPPEELRRLADAAPGGSKLLLLEEANHDVLPFWFEGVESPVKEWFNTHLAPEPAAGRQPPRSQLRQSDVAEADL